MKKLFKQTHVLVMVMVALALILILPSSVYAIRGTEARFYGLVALDGQNVPADSIVTARIGQTVWTTQVYIDHGLSRYFIDIPKDSGQAIRDGGVNGDLVFFTLIVNNVSISDPVPGIWRQSLDIYHFLRLKSSQAAMLKIDNATLPDGVVGAYYTTQMTASGGSIPYSWMLESGALPGGLEIESGGLLKGNPTTAGVSNFTLKVSDNLGATASAGYSITIWKLGDANHDNTVSRLDVFEIIKMYLGIVPVTGAADANQDGKVDLRDAVKVQALFD